MPYKTGELKGQLTTAELRKLVRAHNKLYTIKIPPKATQPDIIKLINKAGYNVNHKKQMLTLGMKNLKPRITMDDAPKPAVKTEAQKKEMEKKRKEKLQKQNLEKEKERKLAKKEGVKEFKAGLKKAKKEQPKPKQVPKPKPKPKPMKKEDEVRGKEKVGKPRFDPKNVKVVGVKKPKKLESTDIGDITKAYGGKKEVKKEQKKVKYGDITSDIAGMYGKKKGNYVEVSDLKTGALLSKKQIGEVNDTTVKEIYDNLVANASPIFFPWTSVYHSSLLMYAYILSLNENDCAPSLETLRDVKQGVTQAKTGGFGKKKGDAIFDPVENLKRNAKEIANDIIRCMKAGKVLCLPISIDSSDGDGTHANMLIFNYHLKTAEHFEPHGDQFSGSGKFVDGKWVKDKVRGINLKPGVELINKYLQQYDEGKELKFKYLSPADVCPITPKKFNGFQLDRQIKTPLRYYNIVDNLVDTNNIWGSSPSKEMSRQFKGTIITEIGGYCAMWSLFFLDTRLKTLKKPVKEVTTELQDLFGEKAKGIQGGKEFIFLMRGMSALAWSINLELVKRGILTEQELIIGLNNDGKVYEGMVADSKDAPKMRRTIRDARNKFGKENYKLIMEKWKKFTVGRDSKTFKKLPAKLPSTKLLGKIVPSVIELNEKLIKKRKEGIEKGKDDYLLPDSLPYLVSQFKIWFSQAINYPPDKATVEGRLDAIKKRYTKIGNRQLDYFGDEVDIYNDEGLYEAIVDSNIVNQWAFEEGESDWLDALPLNDYNLIKEVIWASTVNKTSGLKADAKTSGDWTLEEWKDRYNRLNILGNNGQFIIPFEDGQFKLDGEL